MSVKQVLIIDDEALIRRALADYLTDYGYVTATANDGLQGLARARAEQFDVVLVDLRMPHLDGLEVIATLKVEQPALPIVVVSGTGVLGDVVEAIRRGAWDYVTKPVQDMDEIAVVVERVLERARLIAERDRYQRELEALNRSLQAEVERQTQDLRTQNRELALLNHVIGTATTAHDPVGILQMLCDELARAFNLPQAIAALCKAHHLTAIVAEYCEPGVTGWLRTELPSLQSAVAQVLARQEPLLLTADATEGGEPTLVSQLHQQGLGTLLLVPLRGRQRTLSVLGLVSRDSHPYSAADVALIQNAAAAAAQALEVVKLHQELVEYAEGLETTVARRTEELQAALKQARAADEAKSQFLSNVSHELRTPLTSIRLYLTLLKRGKVERYPYYLENLDHEVDRLQTLIEGLLDLSRLDLGRIAVRWQPTDLNQLLAVLVADREKLFAERGLQLRLTSAPDLPLVQADPKLLEQVATNLLTNAMNYTPVGGEILLHTALVQNGDQVWITFSVQDTGPGIPPEEQLHVFERFYRGLAAQDNNTPGTGLGLAISSELVQLHHGKITLTSALGQGSTFTVWLPGELTTPIQQAEE